MSPATPTTLEGQIERITFRSADTHFMIAKFRAVETRNLITILGHLPEPKPGETMRLGGCWHHHPRYGQQFKVESFELLLPAKVEEIRRYLSNGLIKGIGPKMAERLIRHFEEETLTIIEQSPLRLAEVRGIGKQTARRIGDAWNAHHAVRALMQFLQDRGVKPAYAARIYKEYGSDAMKVLQQDPYQLAADIPRIGFYIADAVVQQSDLPIDDLQRARACLRYVLEEACDEGHMFVPGQDLEERAGTAFNLDFHDVRNAMADLEAEGEIRLDDEAAGAPVYLSGLYGAESQIAARLQAMRSIPMPPPPVDTDQIMATAVKRLAIQLSETQRAVLESVLTHRIVIITGGPGTGKTTLIRAVTALFEAIGQTYLLAAPTGRAARRMAEVTRRPAATIHKLLGFNLSEQRFERDQDDPLDTQALVVDEASMVDALLMGHLLKALPLQAGLILVGDVFQLPSVGPGTVLADLIAAQVVPTYELGEVFRQAAQSPIIVNTHEVRQGRLPTLEPMPPGGHLAEFTFVERSTPEQVARTVVDLCARHIPNQLEADPIRQVQVLTPMHKGEVGTLQLNQMLQAALNPNASKKKALGGRFHLNDKVMHLRNNYQKEVFNGEIGTVCDLDTTAATLTVDFEDRQVAYDEAELEELSLAYAISVHKSQGSEYPVVILPMVTQHYVMLQRNLLYTALTRAQQMVILVGSAKAVRIAVETDKPQQRRSLLAWRLENS